MPAAPEKGAEAGKLMKVKLRTQNLNHLIRLVPPSAPSDAEKESVFAAPILLKHAVAGWNRMAAAGC